MLRIGEGSHADLDLSRAFSDYGHESLAERNASSSIVTTVALTVFVAVMIVSAPNLGPFVERHVFASLSDVGQDNDPGAAIAAERPRPMQLALSTNRPEHIINTVFDSDGSPLATGAVRRDTPAARQAAEVIAETANVPAHMSTVQGLRGSLDPDDIE